MSAGAPIGGFCADSIGWHSEVHSGGTIWCLTYPFPWPTGNSAFIIQFPIAVIAIIAVYFVLDLPQTDHSHWAIKFLRIDFAGAFTLVAAHTSLVRLGLAPVLFAVFMLVETKVAKEPFAPGHVIFDPPLLAAYGANFFGLGCQMAVLFFIALFFQAALHMSATRSGVLFIPSTLFTLCGTLLGGFLMKRTGAGWKSAALTAVGLTVLTFGASTSQTTSLIAIIANAATEDTAVAIACSYFFRSLGIAIGISISTATLQQMLCSNVPRELGGADRAGDIEEQWAFIPVAAFAILAIASSLFIREKRLEG
ncbi:major facilitator superfamily domain-containing protein [Nemania sp. FL0916]|nr:major facilitator superfamily domain-containing protein [Nemania sp. FL0916]